MIDLLASEADGGALVVDYKSDRVGAGVDLEALVERDYGVQRLLYALAVLRDGAPQRRGRALVPGAPARVGRAPATGRRARRARTERWRRACGRAGERGFAVSRDPTAASA